MLEGTVLHADETPVAQLDPGRGKTKRAYLWAYRSNTLGADPPIIVFDYQPGRGGQYPQAFLKDWLGTLMVDDYSGNVAAEDMLCAERRRPSPGRSAQPSRT